MFLVVVLSPRSPTWSNYAKQPPGLFTRMAAKVVAFTMLQFFILLNHKPIGQVKYALFKKNSSNM